jgi:hypothetical protein
LAKRQNQDQKIKKEMLQMHNPSEINNPTATTLKVRQWRKRKCESNQGAA